MSDLLFNCVMHKFKKVPIFILGKLHFGPPELSRDFVNPLNFKISYFEPLNFELFLIKTLLILTVKNKN
jgi:hypothetical protein